MKTTTFLRHTLLSGLCLFFASTVSAAPADDAAAVSPPVWAGTYSGVLPCVDCEGIRLVLTLGADQTFDSSVQYLGMEGEPVAESGMFVWEAGDAVLQLVAPGGGSGTRFRLEGDALRLLGPDGSAVRDATADEYLLWRE